MNGRENIWWAKTPEERQAIIEKGVETRRRNKQERDDAVRRRNLLIDEIAELERQRDSIKVTLDLMQNAGTIPDNKICSEAEIVSQSVDLQSFSGVYFLINAGKIDYVGQSISVFSRLAEHSRNRQFDSVAWVCCPREMLDKLESLYIHIFQPKGNGSTGPDGGKCAPLSLQAVLSK